MGQTAYPTPITMTHKHPATNRLIGSLVFLLFFLIFLILFYYNGEHWFRSILLYLSAAAWARSFVTHLPLAHAVASRFVAGETIDAAMKATRALNERGMSVTLDYLGESVTAAAEANQARDEILRLLDQIQQTGVQANVSLKPSQLGLKLDEDLARDNLIQILSRANQYQNKIRLDMEESAMVDKTLALYRWLRDQKGFNNVGVVIQAYLYRSEADVRHLVAEGAWVRLCKGAYAEPPELAFPLKADTDANYLKLTEIMLSETARQNGVYLGVATHDTAMIEGTKAFARQTHIPTEAFEFQMLYGIRPELQQALVEQGYRVRIYVPYGTAWYPYFMRRLAERPANLWFFISNLFRR